MANISCRDLSFVQKQTQRQLFISKRVVTEAEEFDGGVLVNRRGKIEGVLKRSAVDAILQGNEDLKVIDGGDMALMAGAVDSHVHVNEPGRTSWEGFVTATQAAAAGGITTIVDMPLNSVPPTTTLKNLQIKATAAREEVYVDVAFWGGVVPGNEKELHDLIRAGVVGFKCYLIDSGIDEFPYIQADELENVFAVLNGTGTVLAFHAELNVTKTSNQCYGNYCPSPELYGTYLASRPDDLETAAASLIAEYVPKSDVHVHVVHVSSAAVVPILEEAREKRIQAGNKRWKAGVTAETCHHYLTFDSDQIPPGHTEYKCSPPIRNNTNREKLWSYIEHGRLDLIASDHSPSTADLKGPNFMTAWGGVSSVQFGMSIFWTEASARGYGLGTVSHYLSAGPARLCGLQDKKGALKVGLDADLVFFDSSASFVVTPKEILYKNKISPYMNRVLRGKVMQTYLRGQLIYEDGEVLRNPKGQLLLNNDYFN
ncbi:uncharacterized protein LOC113237297 isoform X2 [Hyposmocoma kahamanoa]|uniref:uncharacterized protein LOC113237297 isoform X2 n=1 Tax=Hyposmocoma kahamanoa TaxID=1477025 RepID=UPI000E6D5ECF|nr:uncharacterized protein LOC113237297 isoform X2 [Hyposmocoma kahamanoa]